MYFEVGSHYMNGHGDKLKALMTDASGDYPIIMYDYATGEPKRYTRAGEYTVGILSKDNIVSPWAEIHWDKIPIGVRSITIEGAGIHAEGSPYALSKMWSDDYAAFPQWRKHIGQTFKRPEGTDRPKGAGRVKVLIEEVRKIALGMVGEVEASIPQTLRTTRLSKSSKEIVFIATEALKHC